MIDQPPRSSGETPEHEPQPAEFAALENMIMDVIMSGHAVDRELEPDGRGGASAVNYVSDISGYTIEVYFDGHEEQPRFTIRGGDGANYASYAWMGGASEIRDRASMTGDKLTLEVARSIDEQIRDSDEFKNPRDDRDSE